MIREHLAARGDERVTPTVGLCRYWLGQVRRELFPDLPPPASIEMEAVENWLGFVVLTYASDIWKLRVRPDRMTRRALINVLAHECVHAQLHVVDRVPMPQALGHGAVFFRYAPLLASAGLTLSVEITP